LNVVDSWGSDEVEGAR